MNKKMSCDCSVIHCETVQKVLADMPKTEDLERVARLFKALGDGTKMRIMYALLVNELCVCDISTVLNMTKSAISHQLSTLRKEKLVKSRRAGKEVFYALDDGHVRDIIKEVLEHIKHS